MKKMVLLGLLLVTILTLGVFLRLTSHTIVGKTTPEAYDLSDSELQRFEGMALQSGDLKSAARVYWYYRFTKRDPVETEKWRVIVNRLDIAANPNSTNRLIPSTLDTNEATNTGQMPTNR